MELITSMPKDQLAGLCHSYGIALNAALADSQGPDGPIDGATLLWALSGRESSFGANMRPRHEPAYDVGGIYSHDPEQEGMLEQFGSAAACSYGPLQIMAVNAKGWNPLELAADPETALAASVARLRDHVITVQHAKTIDEICEAWNGGHVGAKTTPGYAEEVMTHYLAGLPEAISTPGQSAA